MRAAERLPPLSFLLFPILGQAAQRTVRIIGDDAVRARSDHPTQVIFGVDRPGVDFSPAACAASHSPPGTSTSE